MLGALKVAATYSPFFCLSINLSVKKRRNGETTARRERSEAIDRAERQRTPY